MMIEELFTREQGITGKVIYNDIEDSHQLDIKTMDVGLYPIWEKFVGKKINIKITIINEDWKMTKLEGFS
jgi:hypothetical protein